MSWLKSTMDPATFIVGIRGFSLPEDHIVLIGCLYIPSSTPSNMRYAHAEEAMHNRALIICLGKHISPQTNGIECFMLQVMKPDRLEWVPLMSHDKNTLLNDPAFAAIADEFCVVQKRSKNEITLRPAG